MIDIVYNMNNCILETILDNCECSDLNNDNIILGCKDLLYLKQRGNLFENLSKYIEPMLNIGTTEIKILKDGWTVVTKDKKLSAQFEHTIGVTHDGYKIFTLSPKKYRKPPY